MTSRKRVYLDLAWLVGLTLLVRLATALPLERPGYMDAAYYVDGALSLYQGHGLNEPFIWNYLDDPQGIPHPSHLYWMPLSSLLAYASFLVFGPSFRAAQVPFVLLSSLLPAITYLVALDLTPDRQRARVAGLLATFSTFYLIYWAVPDSFAPYAVAGAVCLWAAGRGLRGDGWHWFAIAGLGAGAAHLARADGLLLLAVVLLLGAVQLARGTMPRRRVAGQLLLLGACYLAVMAPWFARNMAIGGRPLPAGGTETVWLTSYDDLYRYGDRLTPQSYLAWGWGNILRSKLDGLWANLGQVAFAGWMIFLAPLGMLGAWRLRRRVELHPARLYLIALYLAMSLAFTYPGMRGGMFHSLSALLPTLYVAAIEGLDAAVAWVARRRAHWRAGQAQRVFRVAALGFAVVLSPVLYLQRLDGFTGTHSYQAVGRWLDANASRTARVMVNDPPSFVYHTGRASVAIPNEDLETALAVMRRYGAQYLVLDQANATLSGLYEAPASEARLVLQEAFLGGQGTIYLFRLRE
jgi:hypothetical protein